MSEPQIGALLEEILAISRRNQQLLEQLVAEQPSGRGGQAWTQPQQAASRDTFGHPDVVDLVQRGKKIEAIKVFRERTGAGLAQAKDEVERLERQMRSGRPE